MKIGGIQKLSLIDYPGHTCAAIFTIGCNMRCGYCHNPELVLPERYCDSLPLDALFDFFRSRAGKLDGIAISGGEPTMHEDLPDFIRAIKQMGFLVKLDTNGTNAGMLQDLINDRLVDYVAMDIKGPLSKYSQIAARPIDLDSIKKSISLILDASIEHEFRTTILKRQINLDDIKEIGRLISGADRFALQKFVPGRTLVPSLAYAETFSDEEMTQAKGILEQFVTRVVVH